MESSQPMEINNLSKKEHLLNENWVLWAHLPHDTDWTLKSYIKIITLDNVEKVKIPIRKLKKKLQLESNHKNNNLGFLKE